MYIFGDHWWLFKSPRERSAMEFAKETLTFEKDFALGSLRHACSLEYVQVDREMRRTFTCILDPCLVLGIAQTKTLAGLFLEQVLLKKNGERKWSLLQGSAHPL